MFKSGIVCKNELIPDSQFRVLATQQTPKKKKKADRIHEGEHLKLIYFVLLLLILFIDDLPK